MCNVFSLSKWNEPVSENPIFLHHTGTQWESRDATVHWRYIAVNYLCYRINMPPALDTSVLGSRVTLACPLWSTESSYSNFSAMFASDTFQDGGAQILSQLLKWAHPTSVLKDKYLHFFYSLRTVNQTTPGYFYRHLSAIIYTLLKWLLAQSWPKPTITLPDNL